VVIELVIHKKFTELVLDYQAANERNKQANQGSNADETRTGGLGAAQGLKHRYLSLLAQIRSAAKARTKYDRSEGEVSMYDSVREVFALFDRDASGTLDMEEFLVGCSELGIPLSEPELESLWPMLDMDGSGEVDVEEFLQLVKKSDRRQSASFTVMLGINLEEQNIMIHHKDT
jgi:hypothetical protein